MAMTILQYAKLLFQWIDSLRMKHSNCENIPSRLIIRITLEMVRSVSGCVNYVYNECLSPNIALMVSFECRKTQKKRKEPIFAVAREELASAFWIAIKFYSSRTTVPNASFMASVTGKRNNTQHIFIYLYIFGRQPLTNGRMNLSAGVNAKDITTQEVSILESLCWDVYSLGKEIAGFF